MANANTPLVRQDLSRGNIKQSGNAQRRSVGHTSATEMDWTYYGELYDGRRSIGDQKTTIQRCKKKPEEHPDLNRWEKESG